MKAVTYQGPNTVEVKQVEDAKLEKKDDIVVRITTTAICGSDLHLYQGNSPVPEGYIIGHEPMGIVEEVGPEVTKVKKGDRVIIPFKRCSAYCLLERGKFRGKIRGYCYCAWLWTCWVDGSKVCLDERRKASDCCRLLGLSVKPCKKNEQC